MAESKSTKGPWTKDRHGQLRSPDGRQVTVWGAGLAWGNRDDETEANGVLVGAAPDLLAELKDFLQELEELHAASTFHSPRREGLITSARAVIAKAEGGAS